MFFHDEIKTRSYFLTHGVSTYVFIDFSWNTGLKSCDLTVQGLPQHTDILPPWTLLLWCLYPLSDTASPWPSLCLRVCASLEWITYWTPIDTYLDFFIDKLSYFFIYKATSEHHKWKEPSFIWCCRIAILKGIHHVLSCSILISLLLYFLSIHISLLLYFLSVLISLWAYLFIYIYFFIIHQVPWKQKSKSHPYSYHFKWQR